MYFIGDIGNVGNCLVLRLYNFTNVTSRRSELVRPICFAIQFHLKSLSRRTTNQPQPEPLKWANKEKEAFAIEAVVAN